MRIYYSLFFLLLELVVQMVECECIYRLALCVYDVLLSNSRSYIYIQLYYVYS